MIRSKARLTPPPPPPGSGHVFGTIDHLSPLISGHLGPWLATGNRARGLAEALPSVMNVVKAKSTRLGVKLKGTVPGSTKLRGTSVRGATVNTMLTPTFVTWLNRCLRLQNYTVFIYILSVLLDYVHFIILYFDFKISTCEFTTGKM